MLRHRLVPVLNLVLTAAMILVPGLGSVSGVSASAEPPTVAPAPQTAADPLPSVLGPAFNAVIRQAAGALGWQVISLDDQIDPNSVTGDGPGLKGEGRWQLAALDERQQRASLAGALRFDASVEGATTTDAGVVLRLQGTLGGDGTELGLDVGLSAATLATSPDMTLTMSLQLTRGSHVNTTKVKSVTTTESVGYGLSRSTTQTTVDRDGKTNDTSQTVTVRTLGHGETELWSETANIDTPGRRTERLHAFRRLTPGSAEQYVDRFDLTQADTTYSLQAPVSLFAKPGNPVVYDFNLVSGDGKTLHLQSVGVQGQTGHAAGPQIAQRPGLIPASWSPPPAGRPASAPDLFGPHPAGPPIGSPQQGWTTGEKVAAGIVVAAAVVALVAFTGGAAVGVAAEAAAAAAEASAAEASGAVAAANVDWAAAAVGAGSFADAVAAEEAAAAVVDAAAAASRAAIADAAAGQALSNELMNLAGGAAIAGLGGGGAVFAGSNADPYFVAPDGRGPVAEASPPLVQITRVTGGLLTPETAITTTLPITVPQTLAAEALASGTYNDRPGAFVGGDVPVGATALGPWHFDAERPFGAVPGHTENTSDGPQRHYFIRASHPLTLTQDDNLVQYVYLDPQHVPSQILLQFYVGGDGEHRVYWGDERLQTGARPGTPALYPAGPLPQAGGWVRLKVPASALDLQGKAVDGVLYGAFGGQTWWGPTTSSSRLTDDAPDALAVTPPSALPESAPGALIGYAVAQPTRLTAEIRDEQGRVVRTLLQDAALTPGYRVLTWDARDETGAAVADRPYHVRLSAAGVVLADAPVTVSPLVATIQTPARFGLVRGHDVPVIGEAYGTGFARYVLDYGAGLAPTEWKPIATADTPILPPPAHEMLKLFNPGNLANWNVGLDEFKPWNDPGLNGVYTLRLRTMGQDGREAVDSVPVIVGRLASFQEGGIIASADGRARLLVPELATREPFALMALVRAADEGQADAARMPAGLQLAAAQPVYEAFPPGETFGYPATLELALPPGAANAGIDIAIGDGTPGNWRFLGGTVDPAKGTVRAALRALPAGRVFVALVRGGTAPLPPPNDGRLKMAPSTAPQVDPATVGAAFYSDFQSGAGDWQALNVDGALIRRIDGPEAGLPAGVAALEVKHGDGVRLVRARSTPFDGGKFPILSFDYRVPPDYAPNILVHANGAWWEITAGSEAAGGGHGGAVQPIRAPRLVADDAWHHYQLDLLGLLRGEDPRASAFQIDEIALGQVRSVGYLQYAPVDGGGPDSAYYLANFAVLAPRPTLDLRAGVMPNRATPAGYAATLDAQPDSTPPESAAPQPAPIAAKLPVSAPDGLYYLHVRAVEDRDAGGWGATTHVPVLLDRTAPEAGRPDPPPGGAGSVDQIVLPLSDATSAVDPASIRVTVDGKEFSPGPALRYEPTYQVVEVMPNLLDPPLRIDTGAPVQMALTDAADYAGNHLAQAFAWTFTADRPQATGDAFRRLTVDGGASPALSPDGSTVAFVATRDGAPRVWLIHADDVGEAAKSAHRLTTGNAHESDPSWSPDGQSLAFVSDDGGLPQIWIAQADGSGAKALTAVTGLVASPSWAPDGKSIAFIQDGNLATVNADGSGLQSLTHYVDRPLRAVQWPPGGSLLAVQFKLYQETIELFNLATGTLTPLTQGGRETAPAWLNSGTLLFTAAGDQGGTVVKQIGVDGSGEALLPGSGLPGASDAQPSAAADGSALAIASTREGGGDIWIRSVAQISRFDVSPTSGVAPGDQLDLSYALPTDATVSATVVDAQGKGVRKLLDGVPQAKGAQSLTWDGADDAGNRLPAGDYAVRLTAQTGAGGPLLRVVTARLLAQSTIGTLSVEVDQWAGTPLSNVANLHVRVYPSGLRTGAVVDDVARAEASFPLPAGRYDIVATYGAIRGEVNGVSVDAGATAQASVDLGLGAVEVVLQSAPGQAPTVSAKVTVTRSDEPGGTPLAASYSGDTTFVVPPGAYDVLVEGSAFRQVVRNVPVRAGQTARQEVALGIGTLRLRVLAMQGQPADDKNGLQVAAFLPADHQSPIAVEWTNPATLQVPAGRYDVRVTYGDAVQWLNAVDVPTGAAVAEDFQLHVGQVRIDVLEAEGKPIAPEGLTLRVYPAGTQAAMAAYDFTGSFTATLTAGRYDIYADVLATELQRQPAATFEVRDGESTRQTVNLNLGHFHVTVRDPNGAPVDPGSVYVATYPAGSRDEQFSWASGVNPTTLTVRAGTPYDVVARIGDREAVLAGRTVAPGQTVDLEVRPADFK